MLTGIRSGAFIILATTIFPGPRTNYAAYQDIDGGAKRIFAERPANPVASRTSQAKEQVTEPRISKAATDDAVDDALALGNSARDANPPRYEDAEKAYKLAARLNPHDERPYIGMANIMFDQHRYVEAAKMYRQALSLLAGSIKGNSARTGERVVSLKQDEFARVQARYHAQLGTCLLLNNQLPAAETEFVEAIRNFSKDARSYALLGYTYFLQNRFNEAASEFKTAIRLDPTTSVYRELLDTVSH